jgi:hypothetical protein
MHVTIDEEVIILIYIVFMTDWCDACLLLPEWCVCVCVCMCVW